MTVNTDAIKQISSQLDQQTFVAATKYADILDLRELYATNVHYFGENKVQDFLRKQEALQDLPIHWHFIGTLQPNKVKYIIDKVELIHSVDTIRLLDEINKQAGKFNKTMDILLQVNISQEETKHGFNTYEMEDVMSYIKTKLPYVHPIGLMTMAPHLDPETTRPVFRSLKKLQETLHKNFPEITELSMGMSNDYPIALEEGSTIIRIGSLLFK